MKNYNVDMLRQKATDIRRAQRVLAGYAALDKDGFLADDTVVSSAKYQLIVLAEAAQAICNHVVARVAERTPIGYGDCYLILGEQGIISPVLAERLADMAKFRNLVVHQYGTVDDGRVFEIIRRDVQDLDLFLAAVSTFLGDELK
jgi:uncharacterized protein YutE (UPF0331/DUF86 family)